MRTNIDLDDRLVEKARKMTGIKTKKDVVEEGLKLLIQSQEQKQANLLRSRMRSAAQELLPDYQPGGELTEFTVLLDSEDFHE